MGLLAPLASSAAVQLSHFPPDPGVMPGGGWQWRTETLSAPGATFAQPTPGRAWVNGVYGSVPKAVATDAVTIAGKAGPLAVSVAQRVGVAEVAGAVARCLAGAGPICAVGTAAAIAYSTYRTFRPAEHDGAPSCVGAELCHDEGTEPVEEVGPCWSDTTYAPGCHASAAAAAVAAATVIDGYNNSCPHGTYRVTLDAGEQTIVSGNPNIVDVNVPYDGKYCSNGSAAVNNVTRWIRVWNSPALTTQCPASVDASNPAYSVPAGSPVGPDGKCPTARYNHKPMSTDQAAAKVAAYPPPDFGTDPSNPLFQGFKDAIDLGGQKAPAEVESTGPSSQTGAPTTTTTTSPTGTTTTTKQEVYNYNYDGDRITYQTVTNTYTCTGAGSCSAANADTTTTTTTEPGDGESDPDSECSKSPDTLGCLKPGTPSDVDLPTDSRTVTVAADSGWGADTGSCPAPRVVDVMGQSVTIDNTLVCDFVSGIRFAIVGVCGLMAAFVFVGGIKS